MTSAIVVILLTIGLLFMLVAAIGFVRFPDVYCRLHVTGVLDTLGAPMILIAVAVHMGFSLDSAKLLLAIVFLFITSPLVGHLLSLAASRGNADSVAKKAPFPVTKEEEVERAPSHQAVSGPAGGQAYSRPEERRRS